MRYLYKCNNDTCVKIGTEVVIVKSNTESSRDEICTSCGKLLTRIYTASAIKTGDGSKS